jgi:hypothetical protein
MLGKRIRQQPAEGEPLFSSLVEMPTKMCRLAAGQAVVEPVRLRSQHLGAEALSEPGCSGMVTERAPPASADQVRSAT